MLAYTLWHWRRPTIEREVYEDRLRAFHAALAAESVSGFRGVSAARLSNAPWANDGGEAYQDSYFVDDWSVFDPLEAVAVNGMADQSHGAIAALMGGGMAGVYGLRLGAPAGAPRFACWFSKPAGMTYAALEKLVDPLINSGAALWGRRMVLGPPLEFCLESEKEIQLGREFSAAMISLQPLPGDSHRP